MGANSKNNIGHINKREMPVEMPMLEETITIYKQVLPYFIILYLIFLLFSKTMLILFVFVDETC